MKIASCEQLNETAWKIKIYRVEVVLNFESIKKSRTFVSTRRKHRKRWERYRYSMLMLTFAISDTLWAREKYRFQDFHEICRFTSALLFELSFKQWTLSAWLSLSFKSEWLKSNCVVKILCDRWQWIEMSFSNFSPWLFLPL